MLPDVRGKDPDTPTSVGGDAPRRPLVASAALLPTGVALGLLVLVWAATTGPVGVLSDSGRTVRFGTAVPSPDVSSSQSTGTLRETTRHVQQRVDLSWLGTLIVSAIWLGLAVLAFFAVRWLWRNRPRREPQPPSVAFEVLPDAVVADSIAAGRAAQLEAVAQGSPRNGIVACWVRLEDAVAAAGLRRNPAETSAELAVRVLHRLDVDPAAIGRLAALYREARFSEHDLGEDARTAARDALEVLHTELRSAAGVRGGPR